MASFRPHIPLHQAEAINRKKQLVRTGIFKQQKVAGNSADTDMLQPSVQADAVVDMHHVIARLKLGQRRQKLFLTHFRDTAPSDPFAEQLFFGDEDQMRKRQPEAPGNISNEDRDSGV